MRGGPLARRAAIVTEASRRSGIGCAVALRLLSDGAGAIHQITATLADALADRGITVNSVNPGPTDAGWAEPVEIDRFSRSFPAQRWGRPDDAARLVAWLVSDDAAWITGQVIDSEGGFRRWST